MHTPYHISLLISPNSRSLLPTGPSQAPAQACPASKQTAQEAVVPASLTAALQEIQQQSADESLRQAEAALVCPPQLILQLCVCTQLAYGTPVCLWTSASSCALHQCWQRLVCPGSVRSLRSITLTCTRDRAPQCSALNDAYCRPQTQHSRTHSWPTMQRRRGHDPLRPPGKLLPRWPTWRWYRLSRACCLI